MQSIGDVIQYYKREKAYFSRLHRRATSANTPPAKRAVYVAESILRRERAGMVWSWAEYGLDADRAQQARVQTALELLR